MSTCGCRVRVRLGPSNQALSAGTALHAATMARTSRAVMSWRAAPGVQVGIVDERGRHDLRMRIGHDPRHVAAHALELFRLAGRGHAGWLRAHRLAGLRQGAALCRCRCAGRCSRRGVRNRSAGAAPGLALPSAAARLTSSMVTVPSAPLGDTRAMSTPSLRAVARTAGIALTPPDAIAACAITAVPTCIAPTTVPASAFAAGSALAGGAAGGAAAGSSCAAPWLWPVSWPSARCGIDASISNSASMLPVTTMSPGAPASFSTLPETGEGTSTTALAVSIETRLSSSLMVSPTLTYHSTMVASGRPSPRSGSLNCLFDMRGP